MYKATTNQYYPIAQFPAKGNQSLFQKELVLNIFIQNIIINIIKQLSNTLR